MADSVWKAALRGPYLESALNGTMVASITGTEDSGGCARGRKVFKVLRAYDLQLE
jgi:hypothetical protein